MSDMLAMVRDLGDQLRWAVDLDVPVVPDVEEIVVAGMGGSGVAGDYLAALARDGSSRVTVQKDYSPLPGWTATARPLVVGISYSGNTEETLDVVEWAHEQDLPVATITTGGRLAELSDEHGWPTVQIPAGFQPRAAIGYLVGALSRLASAAGAIPDQADALGEAALIADEAVEEDGEVWHQAEGIARALGDRITIVYGGGPVSGTVAARWKTQINENAKMPAWFSVLPELNHNELVGWETMPSRTRDLLGVVALTDRSDHDRVSDRRSHSESLTEYAVPWVATVDSWGETPLARLMSLTVVGDLVSWMMAINAEVDPAPVATIEKLKKLLVED